MAAPLTATSASRREWLRKPTSLAPRLAYALIAGAVAVYAFSAELTWLVAGVLVLAALVLLLAPVPARDLNAWLVSLGVQFNQPWVANWRVALADVLFVPLALGTLAWWWRSGRRLPRLALLPWFAGLLVAVCGTGTLMAWWSLGYVPYRTLLNKDLGLLCLVASFLCFVLIVDSRERLDAALRALLVAGIALQVAALLSYPAFYLAGVPSQFTWEMGGVRLAGLLVNPTAYGGFVMVLLLLLLAAAGGDRRLLPRSVAWGGAVVLFLGLVLTFSRSTWFACLVGIGVVLVAAVRRGGRRSVRRAEVWAPLAMGVVLAVLLARPLLQVAPASLWVDAITDPVAGYRDATNFHPSAAAIASSTPPDSRPGWRWTSEGYWLNDLTAEAFLDGRIQPLPGEARTAPGSGSSVAEAEPEQAAAAPAPPAEAPAPAAAGGAEPGRAADPAARPQEAPPSATSSPGYALYMADAYTSNDAGLRARLALNAYALGLVLPSPLTVLFGIGVGSFLERSAALLGYDIVIHNSYVWLFVETGILGLAMLLGILLVALRRVSGAVRRGGPDRLLAVGVLAGLAAMLVWMLANEALYQRHLWLLLALAEVLGRFAQAPAALPEGSRLPAP